MTPKMHLHSTFTAQQRKHMHRGYSRGEPNFLSCSQAIEKEEQIERAPDSLLRQDIDQPDRCLIVPLTRWLSFVLLVSTEQLSPVKRDNHNQKTCPDMSLMALCICLESMQINGDLIHRALFLARV